MVRALVSILLCMCLGAAAPGTAHAVEVGDYVTTDGAYNYEVMPMSEEQMIELYAIQTEAYQGTINTTYVQFFRDIVASLPINHDYVFFRSGDYEYTMYSGDLIYSSGKFELIGEGMEYVITQTNSGSYSNNYYAFSSGVISGASVSVGDKLVYSNLGNYPQLEDRGVQYEFASLVIISIIGLCAFVRPLSQFVLRNGSDNR